MPERIQRKRARGRDGMSGLTITAAALHAAARSLHLDVWKLERDCQHVTATCVALAGLDMLAAMLEAADTPGPADADVGGACGRRTDGGRGFDAGLGRDTLRCEGIDA